MSIDRPTRIVIIGGGYAGAYCAARLEKLFKTRLVSAAMRDGAAPRGDASGAIELTLLDRNNFFVVYPLLIEAGTGSLEPRHAVVALRSFLRRATFRMTEVTAIDFERRTVAITQRRTQHPREVHSGSCVSAPVEEVPFDHLVLAPGSITLRPSSIPGLAEHAFEIKGLAEAVALRDRAIRMLEFADAECDARRRAALLHVVVVGGSFTGTEVAGEFDDFLKRAAQPYPNLWPEHCRITLVERSDHILSALPAGLSRYAERTLRERGVDIRLSETVREVGPDYAVLSSGERLEAHTVIWCAGVAPPPLVTALDLPKDERGYILCEPDGRVRGRKNVWAIGDCAVNPDPHGKGYPATAQHAVREGIAMAANIARVLRNTPTKPIVYRTAGSIAALGCRTGVAEVFGVKLSGFPAWWLFRTVYLLKMPGLARKARVAMDWTLDLFFPREDVQLGVHK